MSETINFKTGWLKDPADNQKFAPKTTTNQVLTSRGERLTDKLTAIETEAANHADRNTSNTFSGEQRMTFPGYCNTVHDIASGIGCSLKNSRALDNQMIVGEIYAPYTSATDESMGMQVVKDEIPFYAIDSTEKPTGSTSQKLNKTLLGKITRNGFEGNASTATSATKATQDGDGFVIKEKYETIVSAEQHKTNPDVHINELDRADISYAATNVSRIISGGLKVPNATNADNATNAGWATMAQQDAYGRNIADHYETKTDAAGKLTEAKYYADTLQANQLQGIKTITSGNTTDKIWHVYTWESENAWAGVSATYSIIDTEGAFSGILAVKFRNGETVESHSGEVKWIAASKKPPKAFITKELVQDATKAVYRLYINYLSTWYTPAITKLHESAVHSLASSAINEQVTSELVVGTEIFSDNVVKVQDADYATSASKAFNDENGHNIIGTYETKADSTNKYNAAIEHANKIKSDLLNGASGAYDTLKELGDLIVDNDNAIIALETVAANKANKDHNHDDVYEKKSDASAKLTEAKGYTDTLKNNLTGGSVIPYQSHMANIAITDGPGNTIHETYETKVDANNKLAEVNTKLDTKANKDEIEVNTERKSGYTFAMNDLSGIGNLKVFGKGKQPQYEGNQLFNPYAESMLNGSSVEITNNGYNIKYTCEAAYAPVRIRLDESLFKPNTTYLLIADKKSDSLTIQCSAATSASGNILNNVLDSSLLITSINTSDINFSQFSEKFTYDDYFAISFYVSDSTYIGEHLVNGLRLIEEGTNQTVWEPFIGNEPSPSINYPQYPEFAGEAGSIKNKLAAKNIFNIEEAKDFNNWKRATTNGYLGFIVQGKSNTNYTVSAKKLNDIESGYFAVAQQYSHFFDEYGNILMSGADNVKWLWHNNSFGVDGSSITINTDNTGKILLLMAGAAFTDYLTDIQIEEGTVSVYDTYKEQVFSSVVPNGLRGIPLGESIPNNIKNSAVHMKGVYFDNSDNKYHIADYRDYSTGENVRLIDHFRVSTKVNIMDLSPYTGALSNVASFRILDNDGIGINGIQSSPVLCNKLINKSSNNWAQDYESCAHVEARGIDFAIKYEHLGITASASKVERESAIKTWVSENELTFTHILAEPIITAIPIEELAQYNALTVNKPVTTFISEAHIEVTGLKDNDTWSHINKEVEKVTPFIATYGQTSLAELQREKAKGRDIKLKSNSVVPGTYDKDGNLLHTWEQLMDGWKRETVTDISNGDATALGGGSGESYSCGDAFGNMFSLPGSYEINDIVDLGITESDYLNGRDYVTIRMDSFCYDSGYSNHLEYNKRAGDIYLSDSGNVWYGSNLTLLLKEPSGHYHLVPCYTATAIEDCDGITDIFYAIVNNAFYLYGNGVMRKLTVAPGTIVESIILRNNNLAAGDVWDSLSSISFYDSYYRSNVEAFNMASTNVTFENSILACNYEGTGLHPTDLVIPDHITMIKDNVLAPVDMFYYIDNNIPFTYTFLGTPREFSTIALGQSGFALGDYIFNIPWSEGMLPSFDNRLTDLSLAITANYNYDPTSCLLGVAYINQLISSRGNEFIFRGHSDKGDNELVCSEHGWATRNIQVIKLGDAAFTYDYTNSRIVLSFTGEGVE